MALSNSARTKKSQLKKQGLSEEEIWKYLAEHGYIAPPTDKRMAPPPTFSAVNNQLTTFEITEEAYDLYFLECKEGRGDIRLLTEMRNILDKRNEIKKKGTDNPILQMVITIPDWVDAVSE